MMRTLLRFGLSALLLTAVSSFGRAADPEIPNKLDPVQLQLQDINQRLKNMETLLRAQDEQIKRNDEILKNAEILRAQQERISKYLEASPPPATGTITIKNTSAVEAIVTIGNHQYPLKAGQAADIKWPAGPFQYEVWAAVGGVIKPRTTRVLMADRPYPITVYQPAPQPVIISTYPPETIFLP